eukprot:TRINITY_DN30629_c0_g1_i1.p1 TRINITY_DN30629_c0_g1~~TRINITY_DN30629_c0_g1_i1.p1  ORF type:complete len:118 (-),score=48.25 TRINITY_DN30629_c0_g1_i1:202-555(-)
MATMADEVLVHLVKTDGELLLDVTILRSKKVLDLKKQVTRHDGTPWKEQTLLLNDELPDDATLADALPEGAEVTIQWIHSMSKQIGAWGNMVVGKMDKEAPEDMADAVVRTVEKQEG